MTSSIIQIDVIIPTKTKYLDFVGSLGERIARELESYTGDREALAYHLNLVLTEATANAIKHTNCTNPEDTVRVLIHLETEQLTIKVFDHGQGFDLETVPIPDLDHPNEGGMGLFLIKTLMDSVTYNKHENCNVLEITKYL